MTISNLTQLHDELCEVRDNYPAGHAMRFAYHHAAELVAELMGVVKEKRDNWHKREDLALGTVERRAYERILGDIHEPN